MPFGLMEPETIIAGGLSGGLWQTASLSGLALATSGVLLAFLYVWSALFRNPSLSAYVKQEFYEFFISGVMVIMIIAAVGSVSSLSIGGFLPSELLPRGVDPTTNVYVATARFYQQVSDDMESWLNLAYFLNMIVDQMASTTPYARPLGVGLVATPMAGLGSPLKQLLYNTTVSLAVAYVMNSAQLYVFIFALEAFLKYYLPLGIFFRCFTPTRRLGGTLIGVALAFLFVFPALSTITYGIFYGGCSGNPVVCSGPLVSFTGVLAQYLGDASFESFVKHYFTSNFISTDGSFQFKDLVSGAFGLITTGVQGIIGNTFLILLIFPVSIISWAFAIAFVVPTVNVLLFTQAAKALSKTFGDEVDVSSLTRLI